ncbi:hypothetical protein KUCAC02_000705 [Chaenocephalus aceratus]|uniref:Uncharacterized protein n=1 Tax=Chaenocephalus aceratus TaxID=36190 RepID=A0ACB9W721_CHAAC|nr:hypothetical protein KUCAC02_000705 [Chaenocephalus aceratus]
MAPMVEEGAQLVAVPVGVAVVSVFGLVFTVSAFAWICCQRKNTKSQKTPPYKFVHMLKGVDIYPESLSGKKKFAAAATTSSYDSSKTDVNGNCHTATTLNPTTTGKLASSPNESKPELHLDLEKRDLNGNFTTKPFHHHHQKVRSSPDLELPSPLAGFTQPGTSPMKRRGMLGWDPPLLPEYQPEKKAFIVHIKEAHGLTPTDEQSLTSDPYIKLTLLPEKKHRVKTRVLRKTLDPAFDETFSFYGIPLARVSELSLHFMVLSFDRFSRDEVIGETLVPLSGIDLSEGRVLMSREIIKKNVKSPQVEGSCFSLCYQSTTNTLTVVVLKARHLPKTENNGPTAAQTTLDATPYVKVNMYQGKKRVCKKRPHVKKCSPNPVFNEGSEGHRVELLLMDSDMGTSRAQHRPGAGGAGHIGGGTSGEHWREICDHRAPDRQNGTVLSED